MNCARTSMSGRPFRGGSRSLAFGSLSRLAMALALVFTGCETVQFGPGDGTDNPSDSGSIQSSLVFMNQRETDPGALTFLLYPSAAMDIDAVAPLHEFGPVEENGHLGVKVVAGRYKVGYRTETEDLHAMPDDEEEGTGADWPVVVLGAGKTYQLLIGTSDGGVTTWFHNFPTDTP